MKQYRVCSRDKESPTGYFWPWETEWFDKVDCEVAIEQDKIAAKADGEEEMTEYKIQERDVSEWRDV